MDLKCPNGHPLGAGRRRPKGLYAICDDACRKSFTDPKRYLSCRPRYAQTCHYDICKKCAAEKFENADKATSMGIVEREAKKLAGDNDSGVVKPAMIGVENDDKKCPDGHPLGAGRRRPKGLNTICDECKREFRDPKRYLSCGPSCEYDICLDCDTKNAAIEDAESATDEGALEEEETTAGDHIDSGDAGTTTGDEMDAGDAETTMGDGIGPGNDHQNTGVEGAGEVAGNGDNPRRNPLRKVVCKKLDRNSTWNKRSKKAHDSLVESRHVSKMRKRRKL